MMPLFIPHITQMAPSRMRRSLPQWDPERRIPKRWKDAKPKSIPKLFRLQVPRMAKARTEIVDILVSFLCSAHLDVTWNLNNNSEVQSSHTHWWPNCRSWYSALHLSAGMPLVICHAYFYRFSMIFYRNYLCTRLLDIYPDIIKYLAKLWIFVDLYLRVAHSCTMLHFWDHPLVNWVTRPMMTHGSGWLQCPSTGLVGPCPPKASRLRAKGLPFRSSGSPRHSCLGISWDFEARFRGSARLGHRETT